MLTLLQYLPFSRQSHKFHLLVTHLSSLIAGSTPNVHITPNDHETNLAVRIDRLQTSVIFHAGKIYAGWEGGPPTMVTVPDLQTQGYPKWYQDWDRPVTAHPKVDPETNEMMFFGFDVPAPHAVYGVLSRKHDPLF
jgi:carotenoid cleavage dioxygenase-like enzyme